MALSWVKVIGAADNGRDVYVGGNFIDPAGTVGGDPFQVETGMDTFMLLLADKSVDRSLRVAVVLHSDEDDPQIVDFSAAAAASATPAPPSPAAKTKRPRRSPA